MTTATPTTTTLLSALAELAEPAPAGLLERLGQDLDVGDHYARLDTSSGPVFVAFSDRGISFLYATGDETTFKAAFAERRGARPLRPATTPPAAVLAALATPAAAGPAVTRTRRLRLTYDLTGLSPFQRAVLDKTAEIPRGEVRPYGWVAREVGQPAAVRAVGTALARNPIPLLIPCHRVVRSDGRIGNYAFGTAMKERLLTEEGIDLPRLTQLAATGVRYVGSATTSVFCLPTCHAARRIQPANRRDFRSSAEAARAGYRPCQRCRPAAAA